MISNFKLWCMGIEELCGHSQILMSCVIHSYCQNIPHGYMVVVHCSFWVLDIVNHHYYVNLFGIPLTTSCQPIVNQYCIHYVIVNQVKSSLFVTPKFSLLCHYLSNMILFVNHYYLNLWTIILAMLVNLSIIICQYCQNHYYCHYLSIIVIASIIIIIICQASLCHYLSTIY